MLPSLAVPAIFVIAAIVVIVLLLREAVFTDSGEAPTEPDVPTPRNQQARYDADEPAYRTADDRRAA